MPSQSISLTTEQLTTISKIEESTDMSKSDAVRHCLETSDTLKDLCSEGMQD